MGAAFFYHLTQSPLDMTLHMLIGKARGAGWRCHVQSGDATALERLDAAFWQGEPTAYLAHQIAGADDDDAAQVLIAHEPDQFGFECLMSVMGAEISPQSVLGAERVCILFNGHDQDAVEIARGQWKTLTHAGVSAQYWAQDDGRWIKKAETSD